MNNFGFIVKETRKKKNLKQREVAEAMTVTPSYISKVESGKEIPTEMFKKLFFILYPFEGD